MTWRTQARLRPKQLAELASCSVRTIRRRIQTGELASYTEGRCRYIPIEAARRFLGEETEPPRIGVATDEARAFVAKLRREAV